MKPSKDQQAIIDSQSKHILVSAAAGSGKTSVMTERVIDRIAKKDVSIQNILMLTFTNKAAGNMRKKITEKLKACKVEDAKDQVYLKEQISLLPVSAIKTFHSFCYGVIKDFTHEITMQKNGEAYAPYDAGIRLLGEDNGQNEASSPTQLGKFLDEAIEETFLDAYKKYPTPSEKSFSRLSKEDQERAKDFYSFVDFYGDQEDYAGTLKGMYYKLRSMPDYIEFLDQDLKDTDVSFFDSRFSKELENYFNEIKKCLVDELDLDEVISVFNSSKNYKSAPEYAQVFEEIKNALTLDISLEDRYNRINTIESPSGNLPNKNATVWEIYGEDLKTKKEKLTELTKELLLSTRLSLPDIESYHQHYIQMHRVCVELLKAIDNKYMDKKISINAIDNDDCQQLCYALLKQKTIKEYYQEQFKEIYIDEYQDTSPIQEAIVSSLSNKNVFMVGDMKQSIYRFRYSDVEIFMNKIQEFSEQNYPGEHHNLDKNFRSDPNILFAVNDLFKIIMQPEWGDIAYKNDESDINEKHELQAAKEKSKEEPQVRLSILQYDQKLHDKSLGDSKDAVILKMIYDMNTCFQSGIAPQDMTVLCAKNSEVNTVVRTLKKWGIPVQGGERRQILQSKEIQSVMSLLRILDNFEQDDQLALVLLSDFKNSQFSESDLLSLRIWEKDQGIKSASLSQCIRSFVQEKDSTKLKDLREKLEVFFDWIQDLRNYGLYHNIQYFLEYIDIQNIFKWSEEKTIASFFAHEKLEIFKNWILTQDNESKWRLRDLINFLDDIQDNIDSISLVPLAFESKGVQVMTLHKSKGLEFPVVFICTFNTEVIDRDTYVIDKDRGLRLRFSKETILDKQGDKSEFWAKFYVLESKKIERQKSIAEKLRVLYVGMTRAENQLFIYGCAVNAKKIEKDLDSYKPYDKVLHYLNEELNKIAKDSMSEYFKSADSFSHYYLYFIYKILDRTKAFQKEEATLTKDIKWPEFATMSLDEPELTGDWRLDVVGVTTWLDWLSKLSEQGIDLAKTMTNIPQESDLLQETKETPTDANTDSSELPTREKIIKYEYPYQESIDLPVKVSVSEIKKQQNNFMTDTPQEESVLDLQASMSFNLKDLDEVADTAIPIKGAQKGTILHKFLQFIPLDQFKNKEDRTEDNLIRVMNVLQNIKILSESEMTIIRQTQDKLLALITSSLFDDLVQSRDYHQELPFTMGVDPSEVFKDKKVNNQDQIIVQGIIDLWFIKDDEIVLVDYKSDNIRGTIAEKEMEFKKRYTIQMDLYAQALERGTGKPVSKKIIWSILDGCSFEF